LLFVVNVHLEGDPFEPQTRFTQIKSVLHRIELRINEWKLDKTKCRILVVGDFNSCKGQICDTMLLTRMIDINYRELLNPNIPITTTLYKHDFFFNDSYDNYESDERNKLHTFYARNVKAIVDYIYYTNNNLQCMYCLDTVSPFMKNDENIQCPNNIMVSDHLPIGAVFEIV